MKVCALCGNTVNPTEDTKDYTFPQYSCEVCYPTSNQQAMKIQPIIELHGDMANEFNDMQEEDYWNGDESDNFLQ